MSNFKSLKRAFLVSDTHFGVRNNSIEWLQIQKDYFYNFFIPLLEENKQPGDFILHCGDVFDSRNSLNLLVMNETITIFEKLAEIMPVIIILGNHDIWKKSSNDVNSLKTMKWIPNIFIFEEPEVLQMGSKKLLLMPWRNGIEEEQKCIETNKADYLFCHTDVNGLKFNKHTEVDHGIEFDKLAKFKKVYSGHIHYTQGKGNFRMLGCPYPMTRSDIGNNKSIWLLDLESGNEIQFENTYSPRFIRILFDKLLELTIEQINNLFDNNFVDVLVDPKWSLSFPFGALSEDLRTYRRLDFIPRSNAEESVDEYIADDLEKIDIINIARKVIEKTNHSDATKEKILHVIKKLHEKAQKTQKDNDE